MVLLPTIDKQPPCWDHLAPIEKVLAAQDSYIQQIANYRGAQTTTGAVVLKQILQETLKSGS